MISHILSLLIISAVGVSAATKRVQVYVALCDNKTQGIAPVGEKIGNGDIPEANLYWGCTEGLGSFFTKSGKWKLVASEKDTSNTVMRKLTLKHTKEDLELTALAYRGSEIRKCIEEFEGAAAGGKFDLVAYIGHNGLMDFNLQPPGRTANNKTEVIVLCCMSEMYFGPRLRDVGCHTLLMTQQLMYPGSFILDAALEAWAHGKTQEAIRASAGQVYAKNQGISVKAATGVFAPAHKEAQQVVDGKPPEAPQPPR